MLHNYLRIFVPIFGLSINVLLQICIARYMPKSGLMKSILWGFCLGFLALFLSEVYVYSADGIALSELPAIFIAHSITYISFAYCYFHFINLGETARRIRIIRELRNSDDGLALEQILERYNAKTIIDIRISRLINNKQISIKDGRCYIDNPAVLLAARLLAVLKYLLLGRKMHYGGYDETDSYSG